MDRQHCSIAHLADLDLDDLASLWSKTFRSTPPTSFKSELLLRLLAYGLQEQTHGSLSRALTKRLEGFSGPVGDGPAMGLSEQGTSTLRLGARLVRSWSGVTHEVTVLEGGFVYRGKHYRSLSEIAEVITGAHWSGPRFFGLKKARPKQAEKVSS